MSKGADIFNATGSLHNSDHRKLSVMNSKLYFPGGFGENSSRQQKNVTAPHTLIHIMRQMQQSPRAQSGFGSSRIANMLQENSRMGMTTPTTPTVQFGIKGTVKPLNILPTPTLAQNGEMDLSPVVQWMNYKQDLETTLQHATSKHF